eukprot:TRINITY_DN11610_c0_g1_i1.p1 TRINITY_DN11610_c0_g1~~TRINITY_DN11610_c0_g1_i1.p1  ORF type:complete len:263 (-),score=65.43 TRINITY_DN11610_c0_g1_i1:20-808(-)
MGNDGGTIPLRCELVTMKKKEKMPDQISIARTKWLTCSFTKQPLGQNEELVSDQLGNVFSKESVLKGLRNKSLPKKFKHVRLRDLKDIYFSLNPEYNENRELLAGIDKDTFQSPFVCPVTGYPVNGNYKFSALPCGHVVCNRAIKEIKLRSCGICNTEFVPNEVLELHPSVEKYKRLYEELKAKRKEEISQKKRKRTDEGEEEEQQKKKRRTVNQPTSRDGISMKSNLRYRKTIETSTSIHDERKRASEAYKSIFTSSETNQ